jgi:hypothetical protein
MDVSAYQFRVLERTGDLPMKIKGRILTEGTTDPSGEDTRAYVVRVFRTVAGSYVGQVAYLTQWNTEVDGSTVYVAETLPALADMLLNHNCLTYFVGYPQGHQFDTKQERLEWMLRSKYTGLVSKLLVDLDVAVEQK